MLIKTALTVLCLSILGSLFGCQYYSGAKVYNATASTEEGKRYVKKYHIKYICKKVYGFYFTDFFRSKDGVYAINVRKDRLAGEIRIRYIPINEKFARKIGLKPDFSWWEKYGRIVIIVIIAVAGGFIALLTYVEYIERIEAGHQVDKMRSKIIPLLVYPSDFNVGFKELEIEGEKIKIYLNEDWEDYKILTPKLHMGKRVFLQLIKLYDRKTLINKYKRSISVVPLHRLNLIYEISSEYKQLLLENKIECLPPIDTTEVYTCLLGIKKGNLDSVSRLFAKHLHVGKAPIYFSRRLHTPGRCHITRVRSLLFTQVIPRIEVSINYANDIKALAAIISHEYTHIYRISNKLASDSKDKEEILTDIFSIILGFDELILQGMSSITPVGYLTHRVVAQFCEIIDRIRKIS